MTEPEATGNEDKLNFGRMAAAAMAVGGVLLAVVSTVWAVARFREISQAEQPSVSEFVATAALLLAAWALGLLLWGAAEILRKLEDLLETLQTTAPATSSAAPTRSRPIESAASEEQARLLDELVRLTREVRDIELLSEPERAARLRSEGGELARQLELEVPALLREHNWVEAHRRVRSARLRYPTLSDWDALAGQVEQARASVESRDIDAVSREVSDLATLGAWARAMQAVSDLQQRHPDSPQVAELVRRAATQREQASAEDRARLMARAQDAKDRRDWPETMHLVEQVLRKYPHSPEAAELRQQLPTVRANVEIHIRQQMEAEIRDLIKGQHYEGASRVVRKLIAEYPDSPQATALRSQLPRLEQKAAARGA